MAGDCSPSPNVVSKISTRSLIELSPIGSIFADVLIHAAAGGVGSMAVQLAKAHGARVIGTASGPEHIKLIRDLGCDQAIDYKATRLEDQVRDVDVVVDPVNADSQGQSFAVLKKGGILVALTEE